MAASAARTARAPAAHDLKDTVRVGSLEVDRAPVTNRRYAIFVAETGHRSPPTWPRGECPASKLDHPVTGVDFFDVIAFALWAGGSLPTEEQWMAAAGLEEPAAYVWGDFFDSRRCNTAKSGAKGTTPVGAYPDGTAPSGCVDLCGNVWEMTCTAFPGDSDSIIVKGGSWSDLPAHARLDTQFRTRVNKGSATVGFRLLYGVPGYLPHFLDRDLVDQCISFRKADAPHFDAQGDVGEFEAIVQSIRESAAPHIAKLRAEARAALVGSDTGSPAPAGPGLWGRIGGALKELGSATFFRKIRPVLRVFFSGSRSLADRIRAARAEARRPRRGVPLRQAVAAALATLFPDRGRTFKEQVGRTVTHLWKRGRAHANVGWQAISRRRARAATSHTIAVPPSTPAARTPAAPAVRPTTAPVGRPPAAPAVRPPAAPAVRPPSAPAARAPSVPAARAPSAPAARAPRTPAVRPPSAPAVPAAPSTPSVRVLVRGAPPPTPRFPLARRLTKSRRRVFVLLCIFAGSVVGLLGTRMRGEEEKPRAQTAKGTVPEAATPEKAAPAPPKDSPAPAPAAKPAAELPSTTRELSDADVRVVMKRLTGGRPQEREEAERFLIWHRAETAAIIRSALNVEQDPDLLAALKYVAASIDEEERTRIDVPTVVSSPPQHGLVLFTPSLDATEEIAKVRRTGRAERVEVTVVFQGDGDAEALAKTYGRELGDIRLFVDKGGALAKKLRLERTPAVVGLRGDGRVAAITYGRVQRSHLAELAKKLRGR